MKNYIEINEAINQIDLTKYDNLEKFNILPLKNQEICSIWKIVRVILQSLLVLPIIPDNMKEILKVFIGLLDNVLGCNDIPNI